MGLRKPPKGGGVELPIMENPAGAEDMAAGTQAINDAGTLIEGTLPEVASGSTETLSNAGPSHASGNIRMTGTMGDDKILRAGSKVMTMVDGSYFGDATAADVASGKTFTSAAGLQVVGAGVMDPWKVVQNLAIPTTGTYYEYTVTAGNYLRITAKVNGEVFIIPIDPILTGSASMTLNALKTTGSLYYIVVSRSGTKVKIQAKSSATATETMTVVLSKIEEVSMG